MTNKYITLEEALAKIKSHDIIVTGLAGAEPRCLLENLHTIADKVEKVTVTTCLPMTVAEYYTNPIYKKAFQMDGWFYSGAMRKAHKNGNISFIPNHLHLAASKRLAHKKPDIYMGVGTMPDEHGYISLSLSNVYEKRMLEAATTVILEINPHYPRTFGDVEVHVNVIDYMVHTNYLPPELLDAEPNEKDLKIGGLIADYIQDGDCIQLGLGGIPNAVTASLMAKKDLGIHTEMFTTGMMRLIQAGVVTGKKKTLHKGKHVAAFALGTKELYGFMHNNPSIMIMDGSWCNDPYIIGQNDNQISINTTIEVDLTGQCASESLGTVQFSGTGGQADTAIGAQNARNGKSFIALYSTAMVRNPATGEKEEVSKIVPYLKPGAAVSLSRNDVDYVVTEYGVAQLRGTTIKERVYALTGIAHPRFREMLIKQAIELGIIFE